MLLLVLTTAALAAWGSCHLFRRQLRELHSIAYLDPVTRTDNFAMFKHSLSSLLQHFPHQRFAIIYSDIKNFKYINDVHGYETGNQILAHYSQVLAKADLECFCRINADNFVSVESYENVEQLLNNWNGRLMQITDIAGILPGTDSLSVFAGIYCLDGHNHSLSIDSMIDRAHIAHHQQKMTQITGCLLYTESMRQTIHESQQLENRMRPALQNGEFVVYLQPKFDISTNKIAAAEALVRWNDPLHGIIAPGKFIPTFERNGFIQQLDAYMFQQVCKLLRRWLDMGIPIIPISVNVSKVQLNNPTFLEEYFAVKKQYDIPDNIIEIEFTESMLFANSQLMEEVLCRFREQGFRSSIDDFGSGYSSLNLLKNLPADILKLDKVFFDPSENTQRREVIIRNVITMAKELSMRTVAEGVEQWEQVEFLRAAQCEMVQGFVFDKPLPVDAFEKKYMLSSSADEHTTPKPHTKNKSKPPVA